jgi:glycosyltransferase involved in cell wall biosynthesis
MPPVPVLYLIHSLGHGGSERQLASVARALDRTKFTPHAASVVGGFRADEMTQDGIPVWKIPLHSYFGADTWQAVRQVCTYIHRHGIALVHTFDYSLTPFGVAAARLCPGVRVLSSQRCYMELLPPRYRYMALIAHGFADGIVVNCEELRRHLHEDYKFRASSIQVCWNGIDTREFHRRPETRLQEVRDAELVIGTVGVLRPEKNLAHLIEAFQRVREGNARIKLLIIGSGPEENSLRGLAARLGVTPQCVFLPSTAEVTSALSSIDIFVHPSLSEGLPNAVMEAMACGCTVLASGVGGCPELIDDGVHGMLFHAGKLDSLVSALRVVVAEPELRCRMAAAAAARIRERFSIEASARRMEGIYEWQMNHQQGAA